MSSLGADAGMFEIVSSSPTGTAGGGVALNHTGTGHTHTHRHRHRHRSSVTSLKSGGTTLEPHMPSTQPQPQTVASSQVAPTSKTALGGQSSASVRVGVETAAEAENKGDLNAQTPSLVEIPSPAAETVHQPLPSDEKKIEQEVQQNELEQHQESPHLHPHSQQQPDESRGRRRRRRASSTRHSGSTISVVGGGGDAAAVMGTDPHPVAAMPPLIAGGFEMVSATSGPSGGAPARMGKNLDNNNTSGLACAMTGPHPHPPSQLALQKSSCVPSPSPDAEQVPVPTQGNPDGAAAALGEKERLVEAEQQDHHRHHHRHDHHHHHHSSSSPSHPHQQHRSRVHHKSRETPDGPSLVAAAAAEPNDEENILGLEVVTPAARREVNALLRSVDASCFTPVTLNEVRVVSKLGKPPLYGGGGGETTTSRWHHDHPGVHCGLPGSKQVMDDSPPPTDDSAESHTHSHGSGEPNKKSRHRRSRHHRSGPSLTSSSSSSTSSYSSSSSSLASYTVSYHRSVMQRSQHHRITTQWKDTQHADRPTGSSLKRSKKKAVGRDTRDRDHSDEEDGRSRRPPGRGHQRRHTKQSPRQGRVSASPSLNSSSSSRPRSEAGDSAAVQTKGKRTRQDRRGGRGGGAPAPPTAAPIRPGGFLNAFARRCTHNAEQVAPVAVQPSPLTAAALRRLTARSETSHLLSGSGPDTEKKNSYSTVTDTSSRHNTKSESFSKNLTRRYTPGSPFAAAAAGVDTTTSGTEECGHGGIAVTIHGMSPLTSDAMIVHPFVRVWLLDCQTGENFLADAGGQPVCGITQPFDLRMRSTRSPWWECEMVLPLQALLLQAQRARACSSSMARGKPAAKPETGGSSGGGRAMSSAARQAEGEVGVKDDDGDDEDEALSLQRAVLLLEVCDAGNETIYGTYMERRGLQRICWGYVMLFDPYGQAQLPLIHTHVQLYPFPESASWYTRALQQFLPLRLSADAVFAPTTPALERVERTEGDGNGQGQQDFSYGSNGSAARQRRRRGAAGAPAIFRVFHNPTARKVTYRGGMVVSLRHVENAAAYRYQTPRVLVYEHYLLQQLMTAGFATISPFHTFVDHADAVTGKAGDEEGDRHRRGDDHHHGSGSRGTETAAARSHRQRRELDRSMSLAAMSPPAALLEGPNVRREPGERPLPPKQLLGTYLVEGCVSCLSLSHSGAVLAVGMSVHLRHEIQLRDPVSPTFDCLAYLTGHTGYIHAIAFNRKDSLLVSCSADMTARVWKPGAGHLLDSEEESEDLDEGTAEERLSAFRRTTCVLVLTHAFPLYDAVFHQDHIITCGCSPFLYAWKSEPLANTTPSTSTSATPRSLLDASQLTAFPAGAAAGSQSALSIPSSQVVSKVSNEETVAILSLSSGERSSHVWSVSSSGRVTCWRAVHERRGKKGTPAYNERLWQMSARRSLVCSGGTQVSASGKYVLVTCARTPVTYVVEHATGQQLFSLPTRLASGSPQCLLPDGEAFVAGTTDGSLLFWECVDGGLCTPAGGYQTVKIPHSIQKITWATHRHLCAFSSQSPLPLEPHWELQQRSMGPTERTAISVAATVRSSKSTILSSSPTATEEFTQACGGVLSAKRRAAVAVAKTKERSRTKNVDKERDARLYDSDAMTQFNEQVSMKQVERYSRMDFIVNFWKGLTKVHRHGSGAADDRAAATDAKASDMIRSSGMAAEMRLPDLGEDHHDNKKPMVVDGEKEKEKDVGTSIPQPHPTPAVAKQDL